MTITFTAPLAPSPPALHHAAAAARNAAVADEAAGRLRGRLAGETELERILLKAAAGAGKSFVLKKLVTDAVEHPRCLRVAVIAFQNRQLWPIAAALGKTAGRERVCLFASKTAYDNVPQDVFDCAEVNTTTTAIPNECVVIVATSHRLGAIGERQRLLDHFGPGANGEAPFDVLFVDEAWQLPHHLFDKVASLAPVVVGVGDVGQLPPIEIGANPWRGDPGYNPYRAWPTAYDDDANTFSAELPAVWRPTAAQLPLWRAFYPEWRDLNCVAAPGDRAIALGGLSGLAAQVWGRVAQGVPVLLEVDGLAEAEAADVDLPLTGFVEQLLDELFAGGFALEQAQYDGSGAPTGRVTAVKPGGQPGDPLVTVLATRNQAVDDATEAVERLKRKHGLTSRDRHLPRQTHQRILATFTRGTVSL